MFATWNMGGLWVGLGCENILVGDDAQGNFLCSVVGKVIIF